MTPTCEALADELIGSPIGGIFPHGNRSRRTALFVRVNTSDHLPRSVTMRLR
jgi:hypothetical protein